MFSRLLGPTDALLLSWTLTAKLAILAIGVTAAWWATGVVPDLLDPWHRWDAPHYTDIAIWGYMAHDPGTLSYPGYRQDFPGDLDLYIVFFPLFPWLVGAVNVLLERPVLSAFLVSTAASLFVAPLLYRLVAAELGPRIGLAAAGFLLIFPTAYFLHIGYTESLFLALSLGSLWMARTDRWWLAALLAGLAALTRVTGLVLAPALAVEALLRWRADGRFAPASLAPIAAVAAGFAAYLALNLAVYGDPFAFSAIQSGHWDKAFEPPWVAVAHAVRWTRSLNPDLALTYGWMELAFTALGLVATVATAVRLRPTWAAWLAGNWLLAVSTGFLSSVPRYSLVMFGIMVLAGIVAERWKPIGLVLVVVSSGAMAYLATRFAIGLWAF